MIEVKAYSEGKKIVIKGKIDGSYEDIAEEATIIIGQVYEFLKEKKGFHEAESFRKKSAKIFVNAAHPLWMGELHVKEEL